MNLIFKPASQLRPGDLVDHDGTTRRVAYAYRTGDVVMLGWVGFLGSSTEGPTLRHTENVGVIEDD